MDGGHSVVQLSVSTWQQPLPSRGSEQRSALLAEVAERVLACGGRRLRVGIDGFTAAGKTSLLGLPDLARCRRKHVDASGRPS